MSIKPPTFWNTFTLGNAITLATVVVGGLMVFAETRAEVRAIREMVVELRKNDTEFSGELRRSQVETDARVRAVELGFGRIEERLIAIQTNVQQITAIQAQRRNGE